MEQTGQSSLKSKKIKLDLKIVNMQQVEERNLLLKFG